MTKFKQGDRVVPEQMTTTERIVEAIKKGPHVLNPIEGFYVHEDDLRTAIASVIGKDRPKIDLNKVELLVEVFAEVHGGKTETIESYWRKKIGYTLEDLTPKTDTTDGE